MHILVATDAGVGAGRVRAALEGPDTTFTICSDGRAVTEAVRAQTPDIAVLDLQIGTMGGMAVTMQLRLDESGGLLPHVRCSCCSTASADIFLARRARAEGWLIKPLDSLRIRRAVAAVAGGGTHLEGVPVEPPPVPETVDRRAGAPNRQMANRQRRARVANAFPGCSAAWLARHVRDVEAGSSNLPTPTGKWTGRSRAARPCVPLARVVISFSVPVPSTRWR